MGIASAEGLQLYEPKWNTKFRCEINPFKYELYTILSDKTWNVFFFAPCNLNGDANDSSKRFPLEKSKVNCVKFNFNLLHRILLLLFNEAKVIKHTIFFLFCSSALNVWCIRKLLSAHLEWLCFSIEIVLVVKPDMAKKQTAFNVFITTTGAMPSFVVNFSTNKLYAKCFR